MPLPAYRGYFENGRFVSPEGEKIPENVEVLVIVVGDNFPLFKQKDIMPEKADNQTEQ